MDTISIEKTKAETLYASAGRKGKKLLESLVGKEVFQKEIMERLQNFNDVLDELGIDKVVFAESISGLDPDEAAYRKVKLIAKAYNQGWVPDWDNSSESKYVPYFYMRNSSGSGFACYGYDDWTASTDVGSRLCFQKSDHAKDAGQKFTEIYKQFFVIQK